MAAIPVPSLRHHSTGSMFATLLVAIVTPLLAGCPSANNKANTSSSSSPRLDELESEVTVLESRNEELAAIVDGYEQRAAASLEALAEDGAAESGIVRRNDAGHVIAVDLTKARARKSDLVHVGNLPYVERVVASLPDVDDASLRYLLNLDRLKVLDLGGSAVSDSGVAFLTELESLEDIGLQRTSITDTAFQHLAEMPNLKRIRCAQTFIMDSGLEHLKDKTSLELLDFRDCNLLTDAGMAHLSGLENLKDLKVWGPQITNAGLEHLQGLKNLRVLSLQDTGVNDDGLALLTPFENLQDLTLFRTFVTSAGVEPLGQLPKLRRLNLRGTMVDGAGMQHLKGLQELRILDLSESIVGNAGLEHLKELPRLENLNLWAARVGDEGMPHLAEIKTLQRLNLDHVGYPAENVSLTDEGVKQLDQLENLEWLHLGKTEVGDEGLAALASLPKLKHLIVTFCPNVTDAGIKQLQQAKPDLKIEH